MALFSSTEDDLFRAVEKGDAARVAKLLAKGLNVNTRNKGGATPLMMASCHDNPAVVQALVDNGAKVNLRTKTDAGFVLADRAVAAAFGLVNYSVLSLAMRTLVGASDGVGGKSTALMWAAACGHVRVVEVLLAARWIDVSAINAAGATALSIARAGSGPDHKKIAEMLERAGAHA